MEVTEIVTVSMMVGFEFGLTGRSLEMKLRQGLGSDKTLVGSERMCFEGGVG